MQLDSLRKQVRAIDAKLMVSDKIKTVDFAKWRKEIENQAFVNEVEVRNCNCCDMNKLKRKAYDMIGAACTDGRRPGLSVVSCFKIGIARIPDGTRNGNRFFDL